MAKGVLSRQHACNPLSELLSHHYQCLPCRILSLLWANCYDCCVSPFFLSEWAFYTVSIPPLYIIEQTIFWFLACKPRGVTFGFCKEDRVPPGCSKSDGSWEELSMLYVWEGGCSWSFVGYMIS